MSMPSVQSIKGYEKLELLGEGAYGAVYRAYQAQVKREVAVKIILPEFANRPDFIRRFESEAQLVAQLEHLHIVPLYDYWRDPGGAYLVMRLMKGGSLEDSLRENGAWNQEQAARLVDQVASALEAAHHQGVVHRDLKPANILLDEESNAYLSDFGIAKELGSDRGATATGAILGTPAYITPEQIQSQPVTPQTDIYALGVLLYELLVGGHPFPETSTGEQGTPSRRPPRESWWQCTSASRCPMCAIPIPNYRLRWMGSSSALPLRIPLSAIRRLRHWRKIFVALCSWRGNFP
jgi:serine/threonine protein kinase